MIIKNIQILRGIAANAIILFHLIVIEQRYGNGIPIMPSFFQFLSAGVDLFFVISGFIMATIISAGTTWKKFLFSRVTRIYPPYWFYTSIMLAAYFVAPAMLSRPEIPSFWRSYLLIPDHQFPLLSLGWTLIHEMYFYLILTAILAFSLPLKKSLALWAGCIAVVPIFFSRKEMSPVFALISHPLTLEFILGAVVGLAVRAGWNRFGRCGAIVAMGILCALSLWVTDFAQLTDWQRSILGIPFALIVYSMAVIKTIPYSKWAVALGNASYSIYLSHILVLSTLGRIFTLAHADGLTAEIVYILLSILAANMFGLISYKYLELPLIVRFRKLTIPAQ